MENFLSTYRLQLHKDFRFSDLKKILPYLKKTGVSTIYASPVFKAVKGSLHGYDILDPNEINPEIGTKKELEDLLLFVKTEGFTWLQDIVPNHMAYFPENPWIMDVLEKGSHSRYISFFDIVWNNDSWNGKLMVPFLGKEPGDAVGAKEIRIAYHNKRLSLVYFNSAYPVQPGTYTGILQNCEAKTDSIEQFLIQLNDLHHTEDKNIFHNVWNELLIQFESIIQNKKTGPAIFRELEKINNNPSYITSILEDQHYRLCHWKETDSRINYRRFFTVNSLICVNIQEEHVLDQHHQLVFSLVKQGAIQGLRVDHIDGLSDPSKYLTALRDKSGSAYIVVEKILEEDEAFPSKWPVQGNTGYDFLSLVSNLLTLKSSEEMFTRFYNGLVDDNRSIFYQIRDKKSMILHHYMKGELENLVNMFLNSGLISEAGLINKEDVRTIIAEFLVNCPVYRYYGSQLPFDAEDENEIRKIFQQVKNNHPQLNNAATLIENILLRNENRDEAGRKSIIDFYRRCMQYTGPLMAKGVEDTLMYTYNRLISHNEVGDSPGSFGITTEEFHAAMQNRQKLWPQTMNATSTHDTKRGEDARARLNVLSQMPQEWIETVENWMHQNKIYKLSGFPDLNDEYLIYQTIIATWQPGPFDMNDYMKRLLEYFTKAFREAKRFTSWTNTNLEFEKAINDFVHSLLNEKNKFADSVNSFLQKINDHGYINSLSQLVLKCTCPGVPDIYQGCELWDLSLVDPDNRRPVDYTSRMQYLDEIENSKDPEVLLSKLWEQRNSGKIKLWLTQKLLELRRSHPRLFMMGDYVPVKIEGKYKQHVFAFARKFKDEIITIAIPLHTYALCKKQVKEIIELDWEDTRLALTPDQTEWQNLLTGKRSSGGNEYFLNESRSLPITILVSNKKENVRGAGILLHISSLPGPFGIGDLGPAAYEFADQLSHANQKFWQILPLNPVDEKQGFSPYSSSSGFAGNTLLISPEKLVEQGLLKKEDLNEFIQPDTDKTDFKKAQESKTALLWKAYNNYKSGDFEFLSAEHHSFRIQENYWLNDFALFSALKKLHQDKPWYEWPREFVLRERSAMESLQKQQEDFLEWISFTQFIFHQQWQKLKSYTNSKGIRILGDLPFYISYDSAETWSNPGLFKINNEGKMLAMAGVPPDAFSESGQLWGMPVYNWPAHKENKYKWWSARLARNLELFDLLRLDHFRAFDSYWEIEAGESTAQNGKWVKGPGEDFFKAIKKHVKELPFIAEDLGEISPEVYTLRDRFSFPGMKVLQFAFGENFSHSEHIPHLFEKNFIVYTGTHDNNTVTGWIENEASEETIRRIQTYAGIDAGKKEIPDLLCRMAFSSVANTVILPLQDVLELGENARMNRPSISEGNWNWKLLPGQLENKDWEKIKIWTCLFNRE